MIYPDDTIIVYAGYPAELVSSPSAWIEALLASEVRDPSKSPFSFYLSGGAVTPHLLSLLRGRATSRACAQKMALKLALGYTSRLIEALLSPDVEKLVSLVRESPLSIEYRILLDLWVLSRSDIYLVDTVLLGRGRCGMEAVYAHSCLCTAGIADSPVLDLWFQYHLDSIVKSQFASSHINLLRKAILADRISLRAAVTAPDEDAKL